MPSIESIYLHSDNQIRITGLQDEAGTPIIAGGPFTMSLFESAPKTIDACRIDFTAGLEEPTVGDTIKGATSSAWAEIASIVLESGTWAGSNAVGYFTLIGQGGTFVSENLNNLQTGTNTIAAITGDSTGAITANAGADTKILVTGHNLFSYQDFVYLESTQNFNGFQAVQALTEDSITIDGAFAAEKFIGDEKIYIGIPGGKEIAVAYSDPYWIGKIPKELKGLKVDDPIVIFLTLDGGTYEIVIRIDAFMQYKTEVDVLEA